MTQRSGSPERRRSPAGGCRVVRPDCGSGHGCQPPGTSRLWDETMQQGSVVGGGVEVQGNFKKRRSFIRQRGLTLRLTVRSRVSVTFEAKAGVQDQYHAAAITHVQQPCVWFLFYPRILSITTL